MSRYLGYSDHDQDVALHRFITVTDARRMALRSFWRGVVIGGILTGAIFIIGSAV
jgi:hypothetical protein